MATPKSTKGSKRSRKHVKGSKRQSPQANQKAIASALSHLGWTHHPLFALEGLGEHLHKSTLAIFDLKEAVIALCEKAHDAFAEAMDDLAAQKHPANAHLVKAFNTLESLARFVALADDSAEGESLKPSIGFRRMVGEVILFYVGQCGRDMERATEALGGDSSIGYLAGHTLADGMRELTAEEKKLVWYYNTVKSEGKEAIMDLARVAKERHSL